MNHYLWLSRSCLISTALATTFSLKAKLYEERQAFRMIDYDNFEGEGVFETGL